MLPTISTGNVASALAGEYEVANSCRFNDGSSDSLYKTFSGNGNRKTFTFSAWVKRGIVSSGDHCLIATSVSASDDNTMELFFQGGDKLAVGRYYNYNLITNALFRDLSAWYHIVLACDTTQSTAANRMRLYVNGSEITSFATASYPSQNDDLPLLAGSQRINIAAQYYTHLSQNTRFLDGYMTEVVMIDGQQLTPTSFGEFDEDSPTIWKPIDVSGLTFGTNGFHLDFENSSSLGADVSGNSNNFTVNNLTSVDQSTDTCTNNFAVLQPDLGTRYSTQTFSNGNLSVSGGAGFEFHPSTIGMTTGKYYFEAKITTLTNFPSVGIIASHQFETNNQDAQSNTQGYVMHFNGQFNNNGVVDYTGTAMSQGDIIMIAFDSGNGVIWFGLNGTWQRSATQSEIEAGTTTNAIFTNITNAGSDSYHFLVQNYGSAWDANFGGTQTYTISSGNSDSNGYGNFEYAVPNGYYSLNTKNLAEFG